MEVLNFNKAEIENKYKACDNLKELIHRLEDEVSASGKVICKISVNGLALSEQDEDKFATTRMAEIESIQLQVNNVDDVVSTTILLLKDFIANTKAHSAFLSEKFRHSGETVGAHAFTELIQQVQNLIQALMALKPHLVDWSAQPEFEQDWVKSVQHMLATLQELSVAYEKQDFVLVSDVLEYELDNSLDSWSVIINQIAAQSAASKVSS